MGVAVIIVNYRTAELTVSCLRSLVAEVNAVSGSRVIVVDNASGDGSVEVIGQAIAANGWSQWVELISADRNGGFAYGNNVGIRAALASSALRPLTSDLRHPTSALDLASPSPQSAIRNPQSEYVLLLNPDTVVRPGALEALVSFMDANPLAGIAGSRLEDTDGTPRVSAFRFPTVLSELESGFRFGPVSRLLSQWIVAPPVRQEMHQTDWVAGASMIIRREVIESVGLMDDEYFLYFEEVDYCLQARRKGWSCWYVPKSRVVHLVGQSTGVTAKDSRVRRRPAYWFASRVRYFRKNHGWIYLMAANTAWIAGASLWRFRQILTGKANPDPARLRRDFVARSFLGQS